MRKSDNVTISSNVLHKKNLFVIRFEVSKFRTGAHITYIVIKKIVPMSLVFWLTYKRFSLFQVCSKSFDH